MKIYYRISDNSYKKVKLPCTNKQFCLLNFIDIFKLENIEIIADRCSQNTIEFIKSLNLSFQETNLGNAGSFFHCIKEIKNLDDEEIVYLIEDDYLHDNNKNIINIISEGITLADYVTLYDHPDKYTSMYNDGEVSKIIKSNSIHWKHTQSTTMSFITTAKHIKQDFDIFKKHTEEDHPNDHEIFCDIKCKGKTLISPIPGVACHTDLTVSELFGVNLIDGWAQDLILNHYKLSEENKKIIDSYKNNKLEQLMLLDILKNAP